MNKHYLAIGGFALIAVLVVAGFVFSPSGMLSASSEPDQFACMSIGKIGERCDMPTWQGTWDSLLDCNTANDVAGSTCADYGCECEKLR